MKLKHELNDDSLEQAVDTGEFGATSETVAETESVSASEFTPTSEYLATGGTTVRNRKSKMTSLSGIAASVAAVVATVILGITGLINVSMQAKITEFVYEDGLLKYEIMASDWTEKESLSLSLYGSEGLLSSYPLQRPENGQTISGNIEIDTAEIAQILAENENVTIEYRVTLTGIVGLDVERVFDSFLLKIDRMTSEFRSVTDLVCHCSQDGRVHFLLDFTDDYGQFSDFEAYIIDVNGTRFDCVFTDNLHDEQSIYIMEAAGMRVDFVLNFKQNGELQTFSTKIDI